VTVLVAADLDGTLIYSHRSAGPGGPLACVEECDGRPASFMTTAAARGVAALATATIFVPVTTRVPEQYRRVRLPGPAPRFAVITNGATILVDGDADRTWAARVRRRLGEGVPFATVWDYATRACDPAWTTAMRNCEDVFCYAVVEPDLVPPGFADDVDGWARQRGWRTSRQGRKLYWVPQSLTKSAAVAEVARRAGAGAVLAAGDSLLDADLLAAADRGVYPGHGELSSTGWSAPGVERLTTTGVVAGEAIVSWLAAAADALSNALA
jgi:hypothetical protein